MGLDSLALFMPNADVAQLVEQLIRNEKVEGSTPFIGTTNSAARRAKKATFRSGLFVFDSTASAGVGPCRIWQESRSDSIAFTRYTTPSGNRQLESGGHHDCFARASSISAKVGMDEAAP
jgi:hypothetical protein